ncbi:MAG: phosphatase PAP2 family protein [Candidatus Saccharimonadales bacterium]
MPSLHAAYATLMFVFVYKLFGKRWALVAAIYPFLIFFGTVYMGEHYAIDEIAGIVYALVGYGLVSWLFGRYQIEATANHYWRRQMTLWQSTY